MPREIVVDWTTASGGGKASVFMFGTSSTIATQRVGLRNFLQSVDNLLTPANTWSIRTTGRELDNATGALTGTWTDGTTYTGAGAVTGEPVPDASQILIRWKTDHIVGGRFLQGRTFIPGCVVGNIDDGNLSAAAVTVAANAAAQLIADAVQVGVWHRPTSGSGGVWWAADSGTAWNELAVLRRRRG